MNTMCTNIVNIARNNILCKRYSTNNAAKSGVNYCASVVRQHDYENFLATLLMTKAVRSPAFVVRAFNVEVSRIQDQTSDQKIADFRLQFWLDALKDIYSPNQSLKNIPANPVAQELYKVCNAYQLPRRHLEKLIASRGIMMKNKFFRNMDDVEKYVEDTVSSVYYLILSIANVKNVHADHAASHLGKAQGIVNLLRSLTVSSHHKMVSLPMDILMKNDVSQETVLRCIDSDKMRNVAYEIASRANHHLTKARSISVPKIVNQIFLPAVFTDAYLQKLQMEHFNVYSKVLLNRSPTLPFQLYYKRLMNTY
ncbi:NADH dehydrogenase (ubiquinone) complex I, assembly factor 6 [Plodia interpunctella]|uniref:NADH dehydrogenase (ubiquinone) complex I, assembly factor 6 n=1 Tax=Plodia interpunctella TaxID=58824 RepID=UPI00236817EE|nr:NADH dehydrogenase (ubiquinone) complex I, assembly factor 6 isoform X1 [Plodia interpunctella]